MIDKIKKVYGSRCSGMIINPLSVDIIETYADEIGLCKEGIEDFNVPPEKMEDYLRYCALVFDPNSPAVLDFPELKLRKEKVKSITGYNGWTLRAFEVRLLTRIFRDDHHTYIITLENAYLDYAEKAGMVIEVGDADDVLKSTQLKTKLIKDMWDFLSMKSKAVTEMLLGDKEMIEEFKASRKGSRKTAESVAKIGE